MVILRTAWTTSCTRWAATARRPRPPRTTRTPIGASARSWGGCTRSEVVDEALAWPSCNCLVQKSTNQRKQEPKEDFDSKQSSSFIPKQCKADFYILMINVIWMIGLLLIILILPLLVSTQLLTQSIKIKMFHDVPWEFLSTRVLFWQGRGGGGIVVSVFAFCYGNLSSNPSDCLICALINGSKWKRGQGWSV